MRIQPADVTEGPELAGNDVVWGEDGGVGVEAPLRVRAADPSGKVRTLFARPTVGGHWQSLDWGLAADASGRVAFVRRWSHWGGDGFYEDGRELWAGDTAGHFSQISPGCNSLQGIGLSGTSLYAVQPSCQEGMGISVHDLGSGATGLLQTEAVPTAPTRLRVAGHYLAWWLDAFWERPRRTVIHVVDLATGHDVYTVDVLALVGSSGYYDFNYDLQTDGKLAVAYTNIDGQPGAGLAWYSIAEPYAHTVPVRLGEDEVALADDKLAVCRLHQRDFAVIDLQGRLLNQFDAWYPTWACGSIAWDGTQLAWTNVRRDRALYRSPYPARPPVPSDVRVALPIPARSMSLRSGGAYLAVTRRGIRCPLGGGTCHVRTTVTAGRVAVARGDRRIMSGRRSTIRVLLTAAGRSLLSRRSAIQARLRIRATNVRGKTSRSASVLIRR